MGKYLWIVLDYIFGIKNFRNEIAWCYSNQGRGNNSFAKKHDTIFFYSKSKETVFSEGVYIDYSEEYINNMFIHTDENGNKCRKRFDKGKTRYYYPEKGMIPNDWWADIHPLAGNKERLGYPTQKPESLIQRIILASTI